MIDDQHPLQIAKLPLGVKCHTPQQQQQQQQQLAAATTMLMSGSEGMLTTLTTTAATAAHNNTTTGATATATATATAAATVATTTTNGNSTPSAVHTDLAKEALCGAKRAACAEVSGNPTTPSTTTAATTTFFTNVNGTCDNHKNNSNATSNNNKSYSSVKTNRINNSSSVNQQLQQQHQLGHGSATIGDVIGGRLLPVACLPSSIVSLYCAGQEVRSGVAGAGGDGADGYDFNDNGDVPAAGDIVSANDATIDGTICNNNNNSNQQLSNNNGTGHKHSNNGHGMPLALHNHTLAQQQQQQHQQQHQQQQHQQQQHQQQQQQHQHHHHHQHSKPQHLQLQSPSHAAQHPVGAVATCGNLPCHTITASVCATAMRASTGASDPYDLAMPLSLSLPLPMPLPLSTMPCRALSPAMAQCGYCCRPICDRYIMRVVDTSFHEGCLKCATCSLHLVHSCFARDGKLYCRIDYERLFLRNRCLGCGHRIAADELVMRTLECVFHLKCFACVVCGILLKKGEQYVIRQGQLFCRFDYEKEVEMLQGYDFYNDDLFAPKLDGRRGPKRPRTILNTQQRRAFKASFEMSPKPCRKVRENLAKETGLSLRIVQVWFQNQRAKVKKIQKKAKQELAKGASDSQDSQESDSSNLAKIKDETHSDGESLLESPYSSCGMGGSGGRAGSVSSTDGFVKLRTVKDENENTSFNCMETNKENCNKTNEPLLNTILGLSYSTFQQLMGPFTQSPMVNPIDRLYSMQNSYFRPEELGYSNGCARDMVEN